MKSFSQLKSAYSCSFPIIFCCCNCCSKVWISYTTASMHILKLLFTSKEMIETFLNLQGRTKGYLWGEMYNL